MTSFVFFNNFNPFPAQNMSIQAFSITAICLYANTFKALIHHPSSNSKIQSVKKCVKHAFP